MGRTSYSKRCCRVYPSPLYPLSDHHLRNDLLLISVFRASILPTVCDYSRISLSAKIRLHSEASCTTTTRKLLKQHRENFHSSKRNDIDNRAAFPNSITPKERVRAQVKPHLTFRYTEQYSALHAWPTPQQPSNSINNLCKRYPISRFSMRTGVANKGKASLASLRSDTSQRRTHTHVLMLPHLSGCVFQPLSICLPHGLPFLHSSCICNGGHERS